MFAKSIARSIKSVGPSSLPLSHDVLVRASDSSAAKSKKSDFASVPQLSTRGILQAGVSTTPPPLRIDGKSQADALWMVCFNRPAMVSVRGAWQPYDAGTACLLKNPAAINIDPGDDSDWGYAFVSYTGNLGGMAPERFNGSLCRPWQAGGLVQAIRGLHAEAAGGNSPALVHHWVELIHGYVIGFSSPSKTDERVTRAWRVIAANLRRDWSVDDMASVAMMSSEHFRRLCLKDLGCSPMKHLTTLRVEKAADLLSSTDSKIEAICEEVGYEYRSTFSNVFTKVLGVRPSAYRDSKTGI
jgi:AraC-like DNA-binding protein